MRKISIIVLMALMWLVAIQVQAGTIQVAAPADISTYVAAANDGDIIELTTSGGAYTWSTQVTLTDNTKGFTVRAASGLASRPVVTFSGTSSTIYFIRLTSSSATSYSKKLSFEGIEFNGYNATNAIYSGYFYYSYLNPGAYGLTVAADNCVFRNFGRIVLYTGLSGDAIEAMAGDLYISNSEFRDIRSGSIYASTASIGFSPANVSITNSLFVGPSLLGSLNPFIYFNLAGINSYYIDHCTFVNSSAQELSLGTTKSTSTIKNCIFSNNTNISYANIYNGLSLGSDCGIYYTAGGTQSTIYPNSSLVKTSNPVFDANYMATAAAYLNAGSDGNTIGYYRKNITIGASTSLSDFRYVTGNGPSAEKSFTVSASGLTSSLTITPPSNYQISVLSGSSFTPMSSITIAPSGGVVSPATIYVRLKAGLAIGNYAQNITLSSTKSTGAISQTLALNGNVTAAPSLTTSVTSISAINGYYNTTCVPKSFIINATALTAPVVVSTQNSYFQVSTDSLTGYAMSITIPAVNDNLANKKVYVRMITGTYYGNYSENLTIASTGFTSKTVTVSGTVKYLPVITSSATSLTGFDYFSNAGTASAIQSFTISGSNLVDVLKVTAPTNYEISTTTGIGFIAKTEIQLTPSSGTVSTTTIYIRLKAGLAVAAYTGTLNITSTDATSKTISLSGTVASPPVVWANVSSLSGMNYTLGNGPSSQQSFTVNGNFLTQVVLISAPTNFEISTTGGTGFTPTESLILSQSGGIAGPTTVYVRLKAGLSANTYNENITIASSGATTVTVALSGIVSAQTINVSTTSIALQKYTVGGGPSAASTFTTGGYNLSGNITLTAPANFELSTNNTTYSASLTLTVTSGMVNTTTIYCRLKSGLAIGDYTGNITVSSPSATSKTIALSARVSDIPKISQSLGGLDYILNSGPSNAVVLNLAGTDLTTNMTVTAPTNFEISTSGSTYTSLPITLTQVNGSISSQKLFVRMKSGLALGTYTGSLSLQSTGATTVTIPLSGSVNISTGSPAPAASPISVITTPGNMKVKGTEGGETIEVYNSNGVQVNAVKAEGDETNIPTQGRNVYIIKVITK